MFKTVSASLLTLAIALVPAAPREAVDNEMNARIRKEGASIRRSCERCTS